MGNERRKNKAQTVIRARVAAWRAEVWTSCLPAMVVLPSILLGGSTIVDTLQRWLEPGFVHAGPLDVAVVTALTCVPFGLMLLIAYGIRRLAPHMKGRQMGLAFADLVGRGVTLIQVIVVGLWIGGAMIMIAIAFASPRDERRATTMQPSEALDMLGVLVGVAGGLFLTGWVGIRRRAPIRCARCGYPVGSVRAAGEVCPECGNRWMRIGELRRFRRISIWWLVGGIGCFVFASAMRYMAWR